MQKKVSVLDVQKIMNALVDKDVPMENALTSDVYKKGNAHQEHLSMQKHAHTSLRPVAQDLLCYHGKHHSLAANKKICQIDIFVRQNAVILSVISVKINVPALPIVMLNLFLTNINPARRQENALVVRHVMKMSAVSHKDKKPIIQVIFVVLDLLQNHEILLFDDVIQEEVVRQKCVSAHVETTYVNLGKINVTVQKTATHHHLSILSDVIKI